MSFKLYKVLNYLSLEIATKVFYQRIPLSYYLFNLIYKKFFVNQKIDEEILKFHNSGYVKLINNMGKDLEKFKNKFFIEKEDLDKISSILKGKKMKRINLSLSSEDKISLENIVKKKLSPVIEKLESYFGTDVFISSIKPIRIHHVEDGNDLNTEHYANHFHQDAYLMLYHKIFINLMDIDESDGPLEVVPIENRSSFFKSFKYKSRNNYNINGDMNLIYKNIGKFGDCCLFSSPQILHRAGIPKSFRDLIQVILVATPKKYLEKSGEINEESLLETVKPYLFSGIVKYLLILKKFKKNYNS